MLALRQSWKSKEAAGIQGWEWKASAFCTAFPIAQILPASLNAQICLLLLMTYAY